MVGLLGAASIGRDQFTVPLEDVVETGGSPMSYLTDVSDMLDIRVAMPPSETLALAQQTLAGVGEVKGTFGGGGDTRVEIEEVDDESVDVSLERTARFVGRDLAPTLFSVIASQTTPQETHLHVQITGYELLQTKVFFKVIKQWVQHTDAYRHCLDALTAAFEPHGTVARGHLEDPPEPAQVRTM
jgi:hypothetical protein